MLALLLSVFACGKLDSCVRVLCCVVCVCFFVVDSCSVYVSIICVLCVFIVCLFDALFVVYVVRLLCCFV